MNDPQEHPTDNGPIRLADHGWFYVGGDYVPHEGGHLMRGAMYVERFIPEEQTQPYPVVMIHGGGQTGTNFTGTPDGRRGWAHDFLRAGYAVYVVDQPARGRSGQSETFYGDYGRHKGGSLAVEERFTASESVNSWPQADKHTRWPDTGQKGGTHFHQFFASQVDSLMDGAEIERLNQDAGAALLDEIGPAILLVHSQSGAFGWLIADARPNLVKAILSIEPNGPPFYDVEFTGHPDWFRFSQQQTRVWGITRIPLTFDPPASAPEEIERELEDEPPSPHHVRCYIQADPPRQLPNLQGIPIYILTAESSYHATYDHATSKFLNQAGVEHEFARLEDLGIEGNGHMIMCETNNHEVADLMIDWLSRKLG